jgi:hypothetical protein
LNIPDWKSLLTRIILFPCSCAAPECLAVIPIVRCLHWLKKFTSANYIPVAPNNLQSVTYVPLNLPNYSAPRQNAPRNADESFIQVRVMMLVKLTRIMESEVKTDAGHHRPGVQDPFSLVVFQ